MDSGAELRIIITVEVRVYPLIGLKKYGISRKKKTHFFVHPVTKSSTEFCLLETMKAPLSAIK